MRSPGSTTSTTVASPTCGCSRSGAGVAWRRERGRPCRSVSTGSLFDPFGYADEARAYLIALDRAGHPGRVRATSASPTIGCGSRRRICRLWTRALARTAEGEFVLVHHRIPGPGQPLHARTGRRLALDVRDRPRAARVARPRVLECDEVWVPCEFNVETFQRGGVPGDRLRVLPETLDFDLFAAERTEPLPVARHARLHVPHQLRLHRPQGLGRAARRLVRRVRRRMTTSASCSSAWACTCPTSARSAAASTRISAAGRRRRSCSTRGFLPTATCRASTPAPTRSCSRAAARAGAAVDGGDGDGPADDRQPLERHLVFMDDAQLVARRRRVVDVADERADATPRSTAASAGFTRPGGARRRAARGPPGRAGGRREGRRGRAGLVERFGPEPIASGWQS